MIKTNKQSIAVIVAHPDDETLWIGGTILSHASWDCFVVSLCRGKDKDRSPKFFKALSQLKAKGIMGDMDDGPEQRPLTEKEVQEAIMKLLPERNYDIIISHNPKGEYTRHVRHEEIGRAVIKLWDADKIAADELWTFAYEDGDRQYFPRPMDNVGLYYPLPDKIWQKKYKIITDIYGFARDSFEAHATTRAEAFWQFSNKKDAKQLLIK